MAGEMEGMQISEGLLVFFGMFWLVPLIMAVLSVTLKDTANRRTNLVLGIIFTYGLEHPSFDYASRSGAATTRPLAFWPLNHCGLRPDRLVGIEVA